MPARNAGRPTRLSRAPVLDEGRVEGAEEDMSLVLETTITCPACGHAQAETMPNDACQFFYDCKGCGALLRPKRGDCCVFCSYGTVSCPPMQNCCL